MPVISELVNNHRSGYGLERALYVEPDIFAADIERVYRRHWLLAGPVCRVARPGDYFTYQIVNDSIVILRDEAGEIRAHHNVCRHRGSRIWLDEQGHVKRLVCPYHNWAYDLIGSLCAARHLPKSVDQTSLGLHPVAVQVVAGLIFICLANDPPEFAATAADVTEFQHDRQRRRRPDAVHDGSREPDRRTPHARRHMAAWQRRPVAQLRTAGLLRRLASFSSRLRPECEVVPRLDAGDRGTSQRTLPRHNRIETR